MKDESDKFPQIGEAYRIDLTIHRILVGDKYLIRIRKNGKKFEIVEVILDGKSKEYIFDCLNLERYLCIVFKCGGDAAQCMYVWVYNYIHVCLHGTQYLHILIMTPSDL